MNSIVEAIHTKAVFARRTTVLARHLAELIPPVTSVLDVGCGDGTIDSLIMAQRPALAIEGVEYMLRPKTAIKVTPFDGTSLPFADHSMDATLFVDVLHHTTDPTVLLREAARVSRQFIIIKDHCRDGLAAGPILRFMDWVGNAHHGVMLPYNYWTAAQWRATFSGLGLDAQAKRVKLGLYPAPAAWVFVRRLHFIAVLKIGDPGAPLVDCHF